MIHSKIFLKGNIFFALVGSSAFFFAKERSFARLAALENIVLFRDAVRMRNVMSFQIKCLILVGPRIIVTMLLVTHTI